MRIFILSIVITFLAALCLAQTPEREAFEDTDSDDRIEVKREINDLIGQWEQFSHTQDEFSATNVRARRTAFDTRIEECTALRDAAANASARTLWQRKINSLTAKRDLADDNTPSTKSEVHPRWEAGRLARKISNLLTEIDDLKMELTALP